MLECNTYSVKEVSIIVGITISMVYKLIHNDVIPYIKLGSRYVIPKDKFNDWFNKNIKGGNEICVVQY